MVAAAEYRRNLGPEVAAAVRVAAQAAAIQLQAKVQLRVQEVLRVPVDWARDLRALHSPAVTAILLMAPVVVADSTEVVAEE